MHELNVDMDVSFFVGQTLIQACFGPHDLILNFNKDQSVTLSIWSSIACVRVDGAIKRVSDFREEAEFILNLLDLSVVSAQVLPGDALRLSFENGMYVEIYDDSDRYESYSIHHDGKGFYV